MLRICFLCLLGFMLSPSPVKAQAISQPPPEYSNGALELTVDHAKPEGGVTSEGQDLYGILTLRLRNVSDEPLTIVRGSPECDFEIDIRDSSGRPVKLTPMGEHLPKSEAERKGCPIVTAAIFELQPGKEFSLRWHIRDLFQLEPGRPYNIRVRWVKGLPAATPSGRQLRRELSQKLAIK